MGRLPPPRLQLEKAPQGAKLGVHEKQACIAHGVPLLVHPRAQQNAAVVRPRNGHDEHIGLILKARGPFSVCSERGLADAGVLRLCAASAGGLLAAEVMMPGDPLPVGREDGPGIRAVVVGILPDGVQQLALQVRWLESDGSTPS